MKHIVSIADMRVSNHPEDVIITHALGSCLGIAVHDSVNQVGGLLHVMMPVSSANPEKAKANPFMFVDTGISAFFGALLAAGASKARWRLTVAGGAMINEHDYFSTGKKNYVTLKKLLWKNGVFIDAEDVGGTNARTMYLEVGTGRVLLSSKSQRWEL